MEARKVTMEQAQDEALVFGVDDDGEFYGETEDGERLEIAEEKTTAMCDEGPEDHSGEVAEMVSVQPGTPDAWEVDELLSECRCIASLLPGGKAEVNIAVNSKNSLCVSVYPNGLLEGGSKHFYGDSTITEAFAMAREWCATYKDRRRADAERKLAEAQAALAALDAEV